MLGTRSLDVAVANATIPFLLGYFLYRRENTYQKTSFYDEKKSATLENSRLIAATVQLINR